MFGRYQPVTSALIFAVALLISINLALLLTYFKKLKKERLYLKELEALNKKASVDFLTKVYNRRFIDTYFESLLKAANLPIQTPISAIMIDIDNFKKINDTYGHAAGDYVLEFFAQLIMGCVRKSDIVARYGGDEFIIILPSTDSETAEVIAERIRNAVAQTQIPPLHGLSIPSITCSAGVSAYPALCGKEDLIKAADISLYNAKLSGKNCTKVYGIF